MVAMANPAWRKYRRENGVARAGVMRGIDRVSREAVDRRIGSQLRGILVICV